MHDRPNYGLNQGEPAFTNIEVGLAVLLSILVYTVLWGFGVLGAVGHGNFTTRLLIG
ncbi:MAG: hypothetical protein V3R62_09970 [Acidiferrobacterales bacterium]